MPENQYPVIILNILAISYIWCKYSNNIFKNLLP